MSSVLQSPSELVPKSLEAQNAAATKLLMSWVSMASPVLKMQAAAQGIQPATPSSRGHWPTLVSPLPWSLSAWLTMELEGISMATETTGTGLVCMATSPLPLFWVVLQGYLLMCLATPVWAPVAPPVSVPGCGQGKSCQRIYWPECKFDLILPVLFLAAFNILTTITAYHLPLYQCVAIAFRILVLSVRFIVPSVVQCYRTCYLVHWLNISSIGNDDESTAWFRVQHCLKLPRPPDPVLIQISFINNNPNQIQFQTKFQISCRISNPVQAHCSSPIPWHHHRWNPRYCHHRQKIAANTNAECWRWLEHTSNNVTRVSHPTRLTIFGHSDSIHVEKNGDSSRFTFFTEWLDLTHKKWLE